MAEVTEDKLNLALDRQTQAFHGLVKLELAPIHKRLDRHEAILESHTATLDAIAKNTEHWKIEAAALRAGHVRHEGWWQQLAKKLGLKLS